MTELTRGLFAGAGEFTHALSAADKPAVDMVVAFIAESVWRGPAPRHQPRPHRRMYAGGRGSFRFSSCRGLDNCPLLWKPFRLSL
jgi:hypothetical protein